MYIHRAVYWNNIHTDPRQSKCEKTTHNFALTDQLFSSLICLSSCFIEDIYVSSTNSLLLNFQKPFSLDCVLTGSKVNLIILWSDLQTGLIVVSNIWYAREPETKKKSNLDCFSIFPSCKF